MAARKTKGTNGTAAASAVQDSESRARKIPAEKSQAGDSAAVWTSLDDIHGWPRNPRKNDDTVWRVVALVIKFGWGRPVGARRENGELVWGHTATAAAHQLAKEWDQATNRERWHKDAILIAKERIIPVRFGEWSEEEAHALAIADNRAQEFSSWDNDLLAQELGEQSLAQAHLLGWSGDALEKMLNQGGPEKGESEGGGDGGEQLGGLRYQVVVDVSGEQAQANLLKRLENEGFSCKPLIL